MTQNLLNAALKYLNSNEFLGPFIFGLSQDTPPGWSPLYDYSLIFGYLKHFPLKTQEMLDDDSLPFKNINNSIFNNQWYEIRIEILLKEIISSMTNLTFENIVLAPKEWYEISSLKVLPMIYTRFIFLRLLRSLYYFGLRREKTIQENFEFLISQCSLDDYSPIIATRFLSLIYNCCKKNEPLLFHDFITINNTSEAMPDISWISENYINSICNSLLLMQNVREYNSIIDSKIIKVRFECCPPWEVNPKNWTPENDYFLFMTVNDIGFSSLVHFFIDQDSPFYDDDENIEELENLRIIEKMIVSPQKSVPISKYRFMFNYETRVNRIKQLVSILYCPYFEKQIFFNCKKSNSLIVLNEGMQSSGSKAPVGYFAYRLIFDKDKKFLICCTVGGTKSLPIFQLKQYGNKDARFSGINIDKVLDLFRSSALESENMPEIPKEMTGSQFFGFDDQIIQSVIK